MAKDCVDCGLEDCGFGVRDFAILRLWAHAIPAFVGIFGICARNCTERAPRELHGPCLRPLLG
eukprot:6136028-Alexandrium_andersonii.AAC.1